MNLIQILFLSTLLASSIGKELETNDISATQPPVNLDSNLRKALLKALTELETEDGDDGASSSIFYSTTHRTNAGLDKLVEKARASQVSVIAKEELRTTDDQIAETTTAKPIVVVQKSEGIQQKPLNSYNDEQFLTSETSSFALKNENVQTRSVVNNVSPNSVAINDKSITAGVKHVSITPKYDVTTTTIPSTTTEENQAKVEDVQFFSAPLVAAFTVHQDERGLPKKVEPIYRVAGQTAITSKQLDDRQKQKEREEFLKHQQIKQDQHRRAQNELYNKQRELERQVLNLQNQHKQQQEYLLRQQQFILEQQQQNQRLLEERKRQQLSEQTFSAAVSTPEKKFKINNFKTNTVVSLQPSLTVTPSDIQAGQLPLNAQILPVRNAIDFRPTPTFTQFNPFIPPSQQTQQNAFNTFQSFPNNFIQSLPNRESNRVFRQEPLTGNFGFNNFNQFQQPNFHQPTQHNRFFRSNLESFSTSPQNYQTHFQPNVNQQLNNLLYHSGISRNVRQNEDLNIVSKVLSYNVGRDNQRIPFH